MLLMSMVASAAANAQGSMHADDQCHRLVRMTFPSSAGVVRLYGECCPGVDSPVPVYSDGYRRYLRDLDPVAGEVFSGCSAFTYGGMSAALQREATRDSLSLILTYRRLPDERREAGERTAVRAKAPPGVRCRWDSALEDVERAGDRTSGGSGDAATYRYVLRAGEAVRLSCERSDPESETTDLEWVSVSREAGETVRFPWPAAAERTEAASSSGAGTVPRLLGPVGRFRAVLGRMEESTRERLSLTLTREYRGEPLTETLSEDQVVLRVRASRGVSCSWELADDEEKTGLVTVRREAVEFGD